MTGVKTLILSYSILIYSLIQQPNGQLQQQRKYKESTEKNQDKSETTIKKRKEKENVLQLILTKSSKQG